MNRHIGYHTRLLSDNTKKVVGGSFGGCVDQDTIERLVRAKFTVKIKPTGFAVFMDKEGREVTLYISVDPLSTEKGKEAKAVWNKQQSKLDQQEQEKEKLVEELLSNYSNDELIALLQK